MSSGQPARADRLARRLDAAVPQAQAGLLAACEEEDWLGRVTCIDESSLWTTEAGHRVVRCDLRDAKARTTRILVTDGVD